MTKAVLEADRSVALLELTASGLLERAARAVPDRVALKQPRFGDDPEISWTYAELLADAHRLASFLSRYFGYGDHVAIWAPNSAHWFLYQFAASHLGIVLVTLNPGMRSAEIEYMLAKSKARGVIMDRAYRGVDLVAMLEQIRPELPGLETVLMLDEWRDHLAAAEGTPPPSPTRPDDPALIVFTSGTTGKPKAAIIQHRAAVNNANAGAERGGLGQGSTWLATLPVFHIGGPVTLCLGAVSQFNTLVVMPPFEPGMVLRLIEQERLNWMPLVPAMLIPMLEHPDFATTDLSSLKALLFGGTVITPTFLTMARERTGADVQTVFGMTEGSSEVIKTRRDDPVEVICETVGTPLPHIELRIVDPATGAIMEIGEIGEIRFKSPYMILGYFGDEEATTSLFDTDGFLRTGDLGTIGSDGNIRISGRLKEMIIRSGMNIYPREIEDALCEFPGIAEAAVIGIPHDRVGEEVAVLIRPTAGCHVDIDEARSFLLTRLARYKVPKHWRIVADFPRNTSGKIQKFELRAAFVQTAH
jgi:fatty-acyl-CoA synthase